MDVWAKRAQHTVNEPCKQAVKFGDARRQGLCRVSREVDGPCKEAVKFGDARRPGPRAERLVPLAKRRRARTNNFRVMGDI